MSFKNINVNVGGPKKDAPYTYKEVILKPNKSFAEQVTDVDRIYVIKWDFDLGGEEVTIPENCVLKFEGGSVSDGTLIGNNTIIEGNYRFTHTNFSGKFSNSYLYLNSLSFNGFKFEQILSSFPNAHIKLDVDIDQQVIDSNILVQNIDIDGCGHTVKIGILNYSGNQRNIKITNTIIDNTYNDYTQYQYFRDLSMSLNSICLIENCNFINIAGRLLLIEGFGKVSINNCTFSGTLNSNIISANDTRLIHFVRNHSVLFTNNNIHDVNGRINFGNGDTGTLKPLDEYFDTYGIIIKNNTFERINGGGVVLKDGLYKNVVIENNYFKQINIYNNTDITVDGEVINMHGFKNAIVSKNVIVDCIATYFTVDFTGNYGDDMSSSNYRARGDGLLFINNVIKNSYRVVLFRSENIIFKDNYINCQFLNINGCYNVDVINNTIIGNATKYVLDNGAIMITGVNDASVISNKNIAIENNRINMSLADTTYSWLCVRHDNNIFDGYLTIKNNNIITAYPNDNGMISLNVSSAECLQRNTKLITQVIDNVNNTVILLYNNSFGDNEKLYRGAFQELIKIRVTRLTHIFVCNYNIVVKYYGSTKLYLLQSGELSEDITIQDLNLNMKFVEKVFLVINNVPQGIYKKVLLTAELVDNETKSFYNFDNKKTEETYNFGYIGGGYLCYNSNNSDYSILNAANNGFSILDGVLEKPVWWSINKWVDSQGNPANAAKKGLFVDAPTNLLSSSNKGFSYFATDKGNDGVGAMIYYTGNSNKPWVYSDGTQVI